MPLRAKTADEIPNRSRRSRSADAERVLANTTPEQQALLEQVMLAGDAWAAKDLIEEWGYPRGTLDGLQVVGAVIVV